MNTGTKIAAGLLLGAAIGAIAGLLSAPQSGKDTRKLISKKTKGYTRKVEESVNNYLDKLTGNYNKEVDVVAKRGKSAINTARESVKI